MRRSQLCLWSAVALSPSAWKFREKETWAVHLCLPVPKAGSGTQQDLHVAERRNECPFPLFAQREIQALSISQPAGCLTNPFRDARWPPCSSLDTESQGREGIRAMEKRQEVWREGTFQVMWIGFMGRMNEGLKKRTLYSQLSSSLLPRYPHIN